MLFIKNIKTQYLTKLDDINENFRKNKTQPNSDLKKS